MRDAVPWTCFLSIEAPSRRVLTSSCDSTCGGLLLKLHRSVVFPCGHAFRLRCLARALPRHERERLSGERGEGALEEALAEECPLCGEAMIDSVGKPFIDAIAEAALVNSWAVVR